VSRRRVWTLSGALVGATLMVLTLAMTGSVIAQRPREGQAPKFQVDPWWPRPLPNNWLVGQVSGVAVDRHDHIWIVHRPRSLTEDERGATTNPPRSLCCVPAPPVLEFDAEGALVRSWGGPGAGYEWPLNEHGIFVDHQDNVWIGGNDAKDHQILKFTREGKFLLQIGKQDQTGGDGDTAHLGRPANVNVDAATNELFVADGYKNHRVIVFDAQTGAYKRHWGANGRPPGDPSVKSFGNPVHCARLAKDGLLYVCDRSNNRIQVFKKDGTFVKEFLVAPATRGAGSVWDVDVSHDGSQTWLYTADGENNHVWSLVRDTGQIVGKFGRNGRQAGQLHWVHNLAVDSKGNIYTAEVDSGKRAQKFVFKAVGPAEN